MLLKTAVLEDQTRAVTDYYVIFVLWFLCVRVCEGVGESDDRLRGSSKKSRVGLCVCVCLSVLYTLYPSMTPFFCVRGTADHVSRILVELTASAVTFAGDPDGTREHARTHKPLSDLPIFDFISIIFPSSCLSPSINPSLNWRASVEGRERWQDEKRR